MRTALSKQKPARRFTRRVTSGSVTLPPARLEQSTSLSACRRTPAPTSAGRIDRPADPGSQLASPRAARAPPARRQHLEAICPVGGSGGLGGHFDHYLNYKRFAEIGKHVFSNCTNHVAR